jgi:hypothetical protein
MKIKTGQAILIGVPILLGVYLIIRQFTKPKKANQTFPEETTEEPPVVTGGGSGTSTRNDNFPLKKGSKGNNVRRLQNALLKLNPSALPKYGADGDFGNETEGWLQVQTGKTTCTAQELTQLELLAAKKTGTWTTPMSDPNPTPYTPPFGSW